MASNLNFPSRDQADHIDIKNTSNSSEFEFKMSSICSQIDTEPSPADELFYKGTLLPLHLHLRLQMFEKLLPNSDSDKTTNTFNELSSNPLTTTAYDYFLDYPDESSENKEFINAQERKHSPKMFKFIKQSLIGSKVKTSRSYFKSLFSKTSCCSTVDCIKMQGSSISLRQGNLNKTCELKFGERSGKFDLEHESSIQSAIAHCKRSYHKSVSDIGFCSLSGSRVVFEDHER